MANVLVEESSLSAIADSIRAKNGTATTYKPAEMSGAIDALPTGGGTMQSKSVSYTPTETAQSGTVTPDTGYDGLSSVSVSVGAIDDEYVGSGITRRSVADLALNGATFVAPAGYYASDADKTMMTGHMSVSATKGTVSNHSVSVTPKAAVDNAGYFATGDRTGTAVSVSASELVSGTKSITQNGTGIDVTEYAAVDVNVSGQAPSLQTKSVSYTPTTSSQSAQVTPDTGYDGLSKVNVSVAAMPSGTEGTPTATKGTVSNHSVSVTPSVTNAAGYISGGTKTGTAVTVSASELDSGTKSITSNGNSQDVVGYAAVNVAVPNSYTSADEGKVVSNGALTAQTSDTVTQNGTVDTTLISSLTVNVSGSGVQYATGTYKPTETYNTTGNREICTLSDIGFTPTKFMLRVKTRAGVSGIQYAVLYAEYESTWPLRITVRYSNSSNTSAASVAQSDWTTQSNYYLYFNNNTIYFRTTSQFILVANLEYIWEAFA